MYLIIKIIAYTIRYGMIEVTTSVGVKDSIVYLTKYNSTKMSVDRCL